MYNKEKTILEIFFAHPRMKFHIREIARLTGLHPNTVSLSVDKLEKEGFLIKKKTKITTDVYANLENPEFIFEKKLSNIRKLFYSDLIEFLVRSYNHPDAIILYGGYANGEDIEKSDIDIAIITKRQMNLNLSIFEKRLGKSIHLLEVDLKKSSKEFINNLINGFVIYGHLAL